LLLDLYEKTIDYVWRRLVNIADFYDRFRIAYGKSKHGLTMQTGLSLILEGDICMACDELVELAKSKTISLLKYCAVITSTSDMPYSIIFH
jgi:hypothetical protein